MSRNTRWKLETTKVKVVFRLQFHATHIPQTGWNNLFISFIPSDSGKASAKTNKANVRNGTCKWADPIYETTRLLQDSKTKQFEEKLYKLVVAMGTSRSSLLGEATINLSDYVVASKPVVVTLPLHGSDSGAILHVTVQLLTSKTGFREFEQQREVSDRGLPANIDHVGGKLSSPGEAVVSRSDKVNQRVRFKPENKELASLEEESGFSEGYADSAAGFDGSSNTSESLYAEKPDISSSREIDSIKRTTSGDLGGVSTSQSPTMAHGANDWIHQWSDENSVERDMTTVYEENIRLKRALEVADLSIHELRQEVVSLQTFAECLSVESRNLTEKIAIEIFSEQNLAKEVSMLKLECLRFKHDLEQVRNLKMNPPEKDLRQATGHSFYHLGEIPTTKGITITEMSSNKTHHGMIDSGLGVELCHPEGVLLPGLLTSGTISADASNEMQGEIFKLLRELDESKSERENLVQKMGQMECYYEALIQELEVNQKQIIGELQNLRHEHGSCIYTISSTKAQMEAMHQQMNNELLRFAEERCSLDALNKELERRAAISEAALKRARLNYSIAVNQLQKDLEVLSKQVVSMYETNENLIRNAFSENSLPFLQSCEETEIDKESRSRDVVLKNHHGGPDRSLEDLKSSFVLQENLCRRMQEELSEMHLENLHLDVFSVTLHHILRESDLSNRKGMHDLAEQLELSFRSNELLRVKLQNISDEVCTLNEEKGMFVSRSNDLALENQTIEAKLRSVSDDNFILTERIRDLESLVNGYRDYKSKYEICDDEKARLVNQLEQSDAEKNLLSNDVSLLQEEVMTMKIKVAENEKLQQMVNYMRENLENLLANGEEKINGLLPCSKEGKNPDCEEFLSIIMRLEDRLQNFHDRIFQLMEEKTSLVDERDVARASFAKAEAEIKTVKDEYEHNVSDMLSKLNASGALVEKLQVDFEAVSNKFQVSSASEEKCTQMTRDILLDFSKMENALHELTSENRNLAGMIMAFGNVTDEFEGNKLAVNELKQENLSLTGSLQFKVNESDMLTKECDNLKGTVKSLQDEITHLRGIQDQLDAKILHLNNQLKERDEKLGQLDQQVAEINLLKQKVSDVESEKSSLHDRLSYADAQLNKAPVESSSNLEFQLLEMHGLLLAADVVQTIVVKQYQVHVEKLVWQLECFHQNVEEVDTKNLDLASRLSNCLANNKKYATENASLLSDLDSLKTELKHNVALNQALEHANSCMAMELKERKEKCESLEVRCADDDSNKYEIAELNCLLRSCQNEIEDLIFSKEEHEIRFLVLHATINEMKAELISRGECKKEQEMLHKKCSELSRKLSEQILKTEEFKNLSVHLKELKDKAEADHLQTREKREAESSSFASQDSLRIAFIREQYETKLQEIRHQLSISKKHGEEMLWKLQDALEEVENRKKCEFSQSKRNEELLLRVTELEAELQLVLSDNRDKVMENEQLKAELECSVMSLDCCKEEKNQVIVSLQESNNYKRKLADEVEQLKEKLEIFKSSMRREQNSVLSTTCATGEALEGNMSSSSDDQADCLGYRMNSNLDKQDGVETNQQLAKEALVTETSEELADVRHSENDVEHNGDLLDRQLKPQDLLSSIERLQKELERMRSENTLLPGDEIPDELAQEVLQRDQGHLEKVSEELENMSSLYNDSPRSGNSVERVLALELELADVLQAKKKPNSQFQSSFLKLHRDESAIFQSFRDINELIKDMLEMKERHATMETELRDMHERYSQLSLDFAEVEGERQKLSMMLKNVRPSKRFLCGSPTSSHEDLSS